MLRIYWAFASLVFIVAVCWIGGQTYHDYVERIAWARRDALAGAKALAACTMRVLVHMDTISRLAAEDYQRMRQTRSRLSPRLQQWLREFPSEEEAVASVFVVDATGRIVATSHAPFRTTVVIKDPAGNVLSNMPAGPLTGRDISSTPIWRRFIHSADGVQRISQPVCVTTEQASGQSPCLWLLGYTRKMKDEHGELAGAVVFLLNSAAFYRTYNAAAAAVRTGERAVYLLGSDGIVRAQSAPNPLLVGKPINWPLSWNLREGGGTAITPSYADGGEQIQAVAAVPDFSLYVGTSEPLWPLRQAMLRAVALNLALLGLLVAVLLALGLLIRRQLFHVRGAVWSQLKVLTRQRERRLLSEVLRSGVMLTMVVDAKGNYVFSNAVFDQMFPALARQEMAAGEWIKKFLGLHRFEFASSRPYQIENSLSDAHGRWRHFSWTIWALKDASGQLRHFVVNGIDNTDRREAELTMYQANKLAQLGEMATALAHELSQPLGAMRLSVENLAWRLDRREADPAQVSRMLFKVGRQLDRAATIVDRMRTFGRKPNGNLGPVDPVKVLEVQRLFAGRS